MSDTSKAIPRSRSWAIFDSTFRAVASALAPRNSSAMPLPFTLLDVSALLSVFLAWHSAYLSQSLTPHLNYQLNQEMAPPLAASALPM